jgi:glycosyltransferase involved in cell wall biosynthesis
LIRSVNILTIHYPPDHASAAILMEELASGLSNKGFKVSILTSQPIYNTEIKCESNEIKNGVSITRISSLGLNKNKKVAKILNTVWFSLNVLLSLTLINENEKETYLFTTNPPILPVIALLVKILKKNNIVLLMYDINPDASLRLNYVSNSLITKLWTYFNKLAYLKSYKIITISDAMKKYITEKYFGNEILNSEKIKVIHNWANQNHIKPVEINKNEFINENNLKEKFIINYSGNIGIAQNFDGLLKSALLLRRKDIAFIFIGDGVKKESIVEFVKNYSIENIHFFKYYNKNYIPMVMGASALSVVHLEKEVEDLCMPSKLYYILALAKPILAFCRESSELGKIIKEADCGYIVSHNEPEKIEEIILNLKNDKVLRKRLSNNSLNYFLKNFTIEKAIDEYSKVLNSI